MTRDEAVEKLKPYLDKLLNFNSDEITQKFLDVTDVDGNVLRTASEELAVGDELVVVTDAGEELTPDAEYKLEDGRVVKTGPDSKIIEIVEADEEVEAQDDEEVAEEMSDDDSEVIDEVIDEVTDEVDEENDSNMESRLESLEALVKELISQQNSIQEATMSVANQLEKFGGTPVSDEVKDLRSTFNSEEKNQKSGGKDKALESIRSMRTKK